MIAEQNIWNFNRIVKQTYLAFGVIIFFWIIVWIFKIQIDKVVAKTRLGSFIYWTTAKLLIWILPSFWLIRLSGRNFGQVLNFSNYKQWLLWGAGIGFGVAFLGIAQSYLNGSSIFPTQVDYGLANVLLISPVFEEFLLRGGLMGNISRNTHV